MAEVRSTSIGDPKKAKFVEVKKCPGLVVKGGDSLSEVCELLDVHFSYLFVVRIVMFV